MDVHAEIFNYMRCALSQAFFSIGESRPNPAVGAVVVRDGIVVGKGRTQRPGGPHAEVMALRDAGECARGAAIYVTLEPCCHYGRTPPCTKAIIEAGISEVYYAHADPNPQVRGKSRGILEAAGVRVFEGLEACIAASVVEHPDLLCQDGCRVFGYGAPGAIPAGKAGGPMRAPSELEIEGRAVFAEIERFFEAYDYFVRHKATFVEVKSAISECSFMGACAPGGARCPVRITGQGANCWNHELRAMSDGILVGAGTLLADNPSLDVRYAEGNSPVKLVWAGHHVFTPAEVSGLKVFSGKGAPGGAGFRDMPAGPARDIAPEGTSVLGGDASAGGVAFAASANSGGNVRSGAEACSCGNASAGGATCTATGTLVYSLVGQPALSGREGSDVIVLSAGGFAACWREMLADLSARGFHRLLVEPGETLACLLFAGDACAVVAGAGSAARGDARPLWNRLDLWRSTDCAVESRMEREFGDVEKAGIPYPELPQGLVASESAMIGPDVLTVYYPC